MREHRGRGKPTPSIVQYYTALEEVVVAGRGEVIGENAI